MYPLPGGCAHMSVTVVSCDAVGLEGNFFEGGGT